MLSETTIKFEKEVEELTKEIMKEFATDIFDMDERQFDLMKKCFGLLNTSMELVKEQANTIDQINNKLDRLLEK